MSSGGGDPPGGGTTAPLGTTTPPPGCAKFEGDCTLPETDGPLRGVAGSGRPVEFPGTTGDCKGAGCPLPGCSGNGRVGIGGGLYWGGPAEPTTGAEDADNLAATAFIRASTKVDDSVSSGPGLWALNGTNSPLRRFGSGPGWSGGEPRIGGT